MGSDEWWAAHDAEKVFQTTTNHTWVAMNGGLPRTQKSFPNNTNRQRRNQYVTLDTVSVKSTSLPDITPCFLKPAMAPRWGFQPPAAKRSSSFPPTPHLQDCCAGAWGPTIIVCFISPNAWWKGLLQCEDICTPRS